MVEKERKEEEKKKKEGRRKKRRRRKSRLGSLGFMFGNLLFMFGSWNSCLEHLFCLELLDLLVRKPP